MTNCFIFAIALYFRRRGRGKPCYIVMRRANNGFFPHFLFGEWRFGRLRLIDAVPVKDGPDSSPWLLFSGRVRWGDGKSSLARTLSSLRRWARDPRDFCYCVSTRYGSLAFFKDQIDAADTYAKLRDLVLARVAEAKADGEARKASRASPPSKALT